MKNRKNNKGFSLVELIVVIAIMAVLIGVLAPQFIKYVKSSKISTDVKNGQEIASCIAVAMADTGADDVWHTFSKNAASDTTAQTVEIDTALVGKLPGISSLPAVKAADSTHQKWYAKWNPTDGTVEVYCSDSGDDYMVYPTDKYTDKMK